MTAALVATACAEAPDLADLADGPSSEPTSPPPSVVPTDGWPSGVPEAPAPAPDPTPLPLDDDIRIGTLPNGLTYLLRSNDTPGASLDLRLVVDAGSLHQEVPDDGSAHMLEHMLFNGTEAFPGNELTTRLQELGIAFGADVNAFTSYDETVYLLGATTFDPRAVDTAFDVLAEWAARATLAADDLADEIGVVRDELRQSRESVDGIVQTRFEELYTQGTPYEGRVVIGAAERVEQLDAATVRRFYDTWYRPDTMAVVAVGDLPLDELEAEVVARFADLSSRVDDPPPVPDRSVPLDPTPRAEVLTVANNPVDYLSLDLQLPVWDLGTVGGERMALLEETIAFVLGARLGDAFRRGDLGTDEPPFLGPFPFTRGLRYYGTNFRADDLAVALDQYLAQLLAVAVEGFTAADVARARDALLAAIDDERRGIGSTQDGAYADELTAHVLTGSGVDDAERRLDRERQVLESLTPEELTDHWRWLLHASGPILLQVLGDPGAGPTADELLEVVDGARPAAPSASTGTVERLMEPPEPSAVVDETVRRTDSGPVTVWTLANGVVVSHQQTDITEGSFDVRLEATGGWSALDGVGDGLAALAVDAVLGSGVGPHDAATLERYLERHDLGLSAEILEHEERIAATAATDDADELFQLLHLTMTGPRVDDVAFRTALRRAEAFARAAESDADLRTRIALVDLLTGGDPRYDEVVPPATLDELDPETLRRVFTDRFGAVDDLHVAVVGDVEATVARELAARYLGTLPTGPADSWVDLGVPLPDTARSAEVELVDDTADGGIVVVDWLFAAPGETREVAAELLATIITNRITAVIREELGASYGGLASIELTRAGPPTVVSVIEVDGDPNRLGEIRAALLQGLADLATAGPTADEFDRAVALQRDEYRFVDDELFLATNLALTRFPDQEVLEPDEQLAVLDRTDPDDVRELAALLYGDEVWVEVSRVLSS